MGNLAISHILTPPLEWLLLISYHNRENEKQQQQPDGVEWLNAVASISKGSCFSGITLMSPLNK